MNDPILLKQVEENWQLATRRCRGAIAFHTGAGFNMVYAGTKRLVRFWMSSSGVDGYIPCTSSRTPTHVAPE